MAIRDIVREILDEESAAAKAAKKAGLVHLGFGRYGPKKGKPATHVSMGGGLEKLGTAKKKSDKKKSKKSADEPQMGPGQPSGDEPQMGLKPFKTKATKIGGGTGVDADFLGEPPEGSREPDDTAGDPEDAWDDEEGRAKPTGKTDADAWEDDPVGGDDVDDEEPEDDEPTIKESVNKRIAVKEVYKWLKGLEEYRYRKIPNVDVRRITSFVNNGLSEIDLPKSLQKKWESAKYSKEKNLADRFVKQKISQKLTQTESKHPLKEQYDRLFTDRTVL